MADLPKISEINIDVLRHGGCVPFICYAWLLTTTNLEVEIAMEDVQKADKDVQMADENSKRVKAIPKGKAGGGKGASNSKTGRNPH